MPRNTPPSALPGDSSSRFGGEGQGRPGRDLYAAITQQVIAMLEKGVVPWRSPILGQGKAGYPINLSSGKPYRGVNVFLLAFTAWAKGYESSYWVTFRQAQERGGKVKRGEKATLVVFFKKLDPDPESDNPREVYVLRHFHVFNALAQCEGVAVPDAPKYTPTTFERIAAAEKIAAGYTDGPMVEHGGGQAFYRPGVDTVFMPEPTRFASPEAYYATLFHELAHSTGHSKRLDRGLDKELRPFGSPDYGKEELVAEMAAAFLCGDAGIHPAVIENQSSYISGWLGQLKTDARLVIAAAGAAQRAAEWVRGMNAEGVE